MAFSCKSFIPFINDYRLMTNDQNKVWHRLKHNPGAIFGLVVIALALFVAAFAYFLSPDGSPFANRQVVEIGRKKPGSYQQFLLLPKEKTVITTNFFNRLLNGQEDRFHYVPISSYQVKGDSLFIAKYIDEGIDEPQHLAINNISVEKNIAQQIVFKKFWLGTDNFGRDLFSRLLLGTRVSLGVGLVAVIISLLIGVLLGAIAGYYKGWVDELIMWLINVIWSIPTLLLVFAITLLLGKGFWQVFIAVGLTMWVNVARLVRGQVLAVRELEYVEAARALGYSNGRIIFRHILPNIIGPILVIAASNFASAIVIEAGLSFLGVGVQPPQPSWGLMIKENYNFIITNNPMLALAPGLAIMLLVVAFNLLGNGLRDALDVKNNA